MAAALRRGVPREDIIEATIHLAVYTGFPLPTLGFSKSSSSSASMASAGTKTSEAPLTEVRR